MTLSQLKEVAANVNADESLMRRSGRRKIKVKTDDVKELRERVADFLTKYANEEDETQDEEEAYEESSTQEPEWMRIGAKVLVDVGEKKEQWVSGSIHSVDDLSATCDLTLDDGDKVESCAWEFIKKLPRAAKKR